MGKGAFVKKWKMGGGIFVKVENGFFVEKMENWGVL